ncbi:MAG: methionine--tRNA ligase [Armatimonadetes bacterium]|nr:methionine--tRNA ligase [Armatimonadota bacterium]
MPKRYYVTTPIFYVNATPHVGHALTALVCDVTKRWHRMRGEDVHFLTGTDENGLKVMEAAEEAGETPQAFVDRISHSFAEAFDSLNIDYDVFFRTTSARHKEAVQEFFKRLKENDYVYLDTYEGWYDVSAETFVKESDLVDGKSPDGNEVRKVKEENWFFRLSAFEKKLLEKIEGDPNFLMPPGRRNEVISFIKQGLRDLCISRTNPGWGIPVPGDEKRVIYVWFDAVINYLAATGWPNGNWEELWPADIHWMAKEIFTRFHATMWPAMLMAVDLPLPKTVIAHGWFVFGDAKMSKSKGNVLTTEELISYFEEAGCSHGLAVDALRYVLAKSLPYDNDTNFNYTEIDRIYNADLANDLGNALNRSLTMAHKFVGGVVPGGECDPAAVAAVEEAKAKFEKAMETHRVHDAVNASIDAAQFLNKYVDDKAPWALAKSGDPTLAQVMRSMLMLLRASEGLVRSFIPSAADAIAAQLGLSPLTSWDEIGTETSLPEGTKLQQPVPMFPRLEKKKDGAQTKTSAPQKKDKKVKQQQTLDQPDEIEFEDFMKVKLRIARIIEAEPVEESKKLMKLQVKIGDEHRQIIAGIKEKYSAEDLIGRQVVVVANLKPRKMMGLESQGMILAADDADGQAIILEPEHEAPEGASVH